MPKKSNQHFVPQFYFRGFSPNGRTVSALLLKTGKIINHAPIKGQCARINFYGSAELETLFSQLESAHSNSIRSIRQLAWEEHARDPSVTEWASLFEAIVFQRARTALEIEKHAPPMQGMLLETFRQFVLHKSDIANKKEILRQFALGNIKVAEKPHATIARHISVALSAAPLITDMRLLLLRNRTDYPFIFSDSPVVFYNNVCRNVRNRGVLGLQCPGLQIFWPLDSCTCLLLLDRDAYSGDFGENLQYDLHHRNDVSQINALQLHHSLNAVYFGEARFEEYVSELWTAHRTTITTPKGEFRAGVDFLVNGKRPDGKLMHLFESQITFDLKLSFLEFVPVIEHDYVFMPRSSQLRDEHRRLFPVVKRK